MLDERQVGSPAGDVIERAHAALLTLGATREARWSGVDLDAARLLGDALVQRPLVPRELIGTAWCHYVHPAARTNIRIAVLSRFLRCERLSTPEYWRNVDRLHYFLLSRIERPALLSAA
jgi:hypothetical protein